MFMNTYMQKNHNHITDANSHDTTIYTGTSV
uniref:Uncharacterized protein n=1 Tax=Arundo donax TaxID=35708 RepID=A0A0A9H587_ARUDO